MIIENMRKATDPKFKTKAFFDIVTKNFRIRSCRLVAAPTGRLIVMLPYREYLSGGRKVYDPVIEFLDVDYIEAVTQEALTAFEKVNK